MTLVEEDVDFRPHPLALCEIGPSPKNLVMKLAEVMQAVERVQKRGHNSFHNYDYATESDIVATVRKELAERHIMLVPGIAAMRREPVGEKGSVLTTLDMTFTFIDGESGEQLERPWMGAGTDKEDKGLYKAMTGGEKYFLLKTFLMPTGDDPERDEPQTKGKTTSRTPPSPPLAAAYPAAPVREGTHPSVPNGGDSGASDTPPPGFHYIHEYAFENGWHNLTIRNYDAQGGAIHLSTKQDVGFQAEKACAERIPVQVAWKAKGNSKGEGYLSKVFFYEAPTTEAPPAAPVTADQIPF